MRLGTSIGVMRIAWLALLFATAATARPQSASDFPIVTDRPSFSDGPFIVPRGRWQVETGVAATNIGGGVRLNTFGEALL